MLTDINLSPSCSFFEFILPDGTLKLRCWQPGGSKRGLVLLVHGLGAAGAWFEACARELSGRGFLVYAYDLRGFGSRSAESFKSYNEWLDELCLIVRHLRSCNGGLPFYLLGNSMGALVVIAAAVLLELDGIIVSSPGFDGHPDSFTLLYRLKSVLCALLNSKSQVALPYEMDMVTRDPGVRLWLAEASPGKPTVPAAMLFELLKLSTRVLADLKEVKAPVLMLTAGQDRIVNNKVSEKLFKRLAAPSKKHVCLQEAWHDLMFDPLVDEVADEIAGWQAELAGSRQSSGACAGQPGI
jgi:acylglycerol lipase